MEQSSLKEVVSGDENKLEMLVEADGANFSVGQRQLICLARAMLRHSKILVMDEATANVDAETDAFIQKAIRDSFQDSTVLTIAHRLNTVADYDKILVMSEGRIVEFDTPLALLGQYDGVFASMVRETGPTNAAMIKEIASTGKQ